MSKYFIEKVELYILSLWLLFLLVVVVTFDFSALSALWNGRIGWIQFVSSNAISLVAGVFLLGGAVYYLRFDYKISGSSSVPVSISEVEDVNFEHLTFLTTYIIPLVCIDLSSGRYVLVLLVLLIVIGIIYVKTDKFYANPSLALLGFRLYRAKIRKRTREEVRVILLTKGSLSANSKIRYIELDNRVFYAKEA